MSTKFLLLLLLLPKINSLITSSEPIALFCDDYKTAINFEPALGVVVALLTFFLNPFPTFVW